MNTKQANIFARVSLTVLGLFLLFWLSSEFNTRKAVLIEQFQLAEEKEALDSTFDSLQTGLVAIDSTLSTFNEDMNIENLDKLKSVLQTLSRTFPGVSPSMSDSILQTIIQNPDTMLTFGDTTFREPLSITISMNDEVWGEPQKYYEGINQQAFRQIIPQIIFAALLFGLVFLTVFFFRKNIKKQEALNQERSNLISNLTHELKTPVATIAVALEGIDELQRLTSGINSMLQISKVSQENPYFKSEKVDLNELCHTAVKSLSMQAQQLDIELSSDISVKKLLTQGDAQHLQNVIINLLDNAIKYRKPDQAKVALILEEKQDHIELHVQDNGIGIDKAYHQHIFDRFYRITEENIHNVKGYGMGLSYVRKVLDAHDAPIRVDSKLGEGSTFTVNFKKAS